MKGTEMTQGHLYLFYLLYFTYPRNNFEFPEHITKSELMV